MEKYTKEVMEGLSVIGRIILAGECANDEFSWLNELFSERINNPKKIIEEVLSALKEGASQAVEIFTGDACLDINEDMASQISALMLNEHDDPDYYSGKNSQSVRCAGILKAFDAFDAVTYIGISASRHKDLLLPAVIDASFKQAISEIYENEIMNDNISYFRLIPLNNLRKAIISNIPENERYLFPWYGDYSEYPANTLYYIAEKLSGTESFGNPDISENDISVLAYMISAEDPRLMSRIKDEALVYRLLPRAIEMAYAFRWLGSADDCAGNYRVSRQVSESGLVNGAIRVIARDVINGISGDDYRFRAALCGTGLSDKKRLELLKPIEKLVKKGIFINSLISWDKSSPTGDDELSNHHFRRWVDELESVAANGYRCIKHDRKVLVKLLTSYNPVNLAKAILSLDENPSAENYEKYITALYI